MGWVVLFFCGSVSMAEGQDDAWTSRELEKREWRRKHGLFLQKRDHALQSFQACRAKCFTDSGVKIVREAMDWMRQTLQWQRKIKDLEEEALDHVSVGCFQRFRFQSKYKRLLHTHRLLGQLLQERSWLIQEEWRRLDPLREQGG
jgi:hypothetical protein